MLIWQSAGGSNLAAAQAIHRERSIWQLEISAGSAFQRWRLVRPNLFQEIRVFAMSQLYRLNALQNELRDVLSLSLNDYRLQVQENDVRANFIGLQLRSVFQPIFDLATNAPFGYEALLRAFDHEGNAIAPPTTFKRAEVAEKLVKFDRLCRALHTLNYFNMGPSKELLFSQCTSRAASGSQYEYCIIIRCQQIKS